MHRTGFVGYRSFCQVAICTVVAYGCGLVWAQHASETLSVTIEGIVTSSSDQPEIATVELEEGGRPQDQAVAQLPRPASRPASGWIVGNSHLGITSGLPVIQAQS